MKYYLAHPFDSRHEIRKWELEFEARTGIELINPFYDNDIHRQDVLEADRTGINRRTKPFNQVVEDDLELIKNSNGIVAIIDGHLSIGTPQEMVYGFIWGKPTYTVVTDGRENHPWLRYHSTEIFTSFDDLEFKLVQINEMSN